MVSQDERTQTADEPTQAADAAPSASAEAAAPQPEAAMSAAPAPASLDGDALQKQAQEYLQGWQRERAEFANYKRRVERELKDSHQNAAVTVLKGVLPIIDDFDRALASAPAELVNSPWLNGVALIQRKLNKMLDDNGITPIDPRGQVFDPNQHEAVGMDDSAEVETGHVTVVLQKGYLYGDRVLRPALVRVAG